MLTQLIVVHDDETRKDAVIMFKPDPYPSLLIFIIHPLNLFSKYIPNACSNINTSKRTLLCLFITTNKHNNVRLLHPIGSLACMRYQRNKPGPCYCKCNNQHLRDICAKWHLIDLVKSHKTFYILPYHFHCLKQHEIRYIGIAIYSWLVRRSRTSKVT